MRDRVRAFVDARIRPHIADWFDRAHLPGRARPELGELGVLGMTPRRIRMPRPQRRRVRPRGARARGRRLRHPHVRVGAGLARDGLDPSLGQRGAEAGVAAADGARRGRSAASGSPSPTPARDPSSMKTFARRDGDDWVLTGSKRWIGLASIAQSRWSGRRPTTACAASSCPTDAPGFTATLLEPKLSMRASIQCELHFDDVRLPAAALLPGARGLRGPFSALNEARYGIVWGALGAGRDSYEAALRYALRARAVRPADRGVPADAAEAREHGASSCRRARCSRCTSDG